MRSACDCARRWVLCAGRWVPISFRRAQRPTGARGRRQRRRSSRKTIWKAIRRSRPMPEGDNLFRAATTLRKALQGGRVVRFRSDVALVLRAAEQKAVEGSRIAAVDARGKHLLIRFDDERILRTHLRMSGSWHLYRSGESWRRPEHRARVAIETDGGFVAVCFDAPVVQLGSEFSMRDLEKLGPDATTAAF